MNDKHIDFTSLGLASTLIIFLFITPKPIWNNPYCLKRNTINCDLFDFKGRSF